MEQERPLSLRDVRRMLEGVVPPAMCTASPDGVPHVNYLSHAEYVDENHVALTYQFFNRSRQNVLATRRAALSIDDPYTGAGMVMQLEYIRTETSGPLFERLRAKLAGIASHTGMEKVFKLLGADLYRVLELRRVPGRRELPAAQPRCDLAAGSRALSERLAGCTDLAELLDTTMAGLSEFLRIEHAILWLMDEVRPCLYTIASRGYESSGIGAELPYGEGLAGIAAREGVPIRIGHMTQSYTYGRAIRSTAHALGLHTMLEQEVPLPGMEAPRSQLAVPLRAKGRVAGVLLVESTHEQFFSYDDEDALMLLCGQLASSLTLLQPKDGESAATAAPVSSTTPAGKSVLVRRFAQDDSIFFDDDYLIKGVAGAILWKLVNEFVLRGRSEFTNRELRLAADLRLPDVQDNLEVRLLLLQRRLSERNAPVQIEKTGRGRFRLNVHHPLTLSEVAKAAG
jgi:adenylate cyclase